MREYMAGVGRAVLLRAVVGMLVLVGGVFWHSAQGRSSDGERDDGPAVCRPPEPDWPSGYPALCAALNRPDLAELVGAPGEHAVSAGIGSYSPWETGAAQVQVGKVKAAVSESPTLPYDLLLDDPRVSAREVAPLAGRPAVAYSEPLRWMVIHLGTGSPGPGAVSGGGRSPGGTAYHLVVARNADGSGGSLEVSLWREDGGYVNDDLLPGLAEELMADLEGWDGPPLPAEPGEPTRPPRPSPSPTSFRPFSGGR
ncbi:DUF6215 domain-containing protein [Kitasatospora phosalacinea]|uniref:DUF6215 domain-containing protein n=1 Tax=Kitasatospora phosalacinea TaxID=2065 RepID=A0ABW6GEU9_9ACTN